MLIELKCKNCDGALDPKTLKCPYCGSQYKEMYEGGKMVYVQTCPAQIETLRARVNVSNEMVMMADAEGLSRYALNEMAHALAQELLRYTKIEKKYDPYTMTQIIGGTVRVVKPDFRF